MFKNIKKKRESLILILIVATLIMAAYKDNFPSRHSLMLVLATPVTAIAGLALSGRKGGLAVADSMTGQVYSFDQPKWINPDSPSRNYYMGLRYLKIANYPESLDFFKMALNEQLESSKPNHEETAKIYNSLGSVCYYSEEYDEAIDYYHCAINAYGEVSRQQTGEIFTAFCQNMARTYFGQENYEKALEWYQKVLAAEEETLGLGHPHTAAAYDNIARSYFFQKDYRLALTWYGRSYGILLRKLGDEHPKTNLAIANMKTAYKKIGLPEPFEQWLREMS
ncbi:MAG: tetratricopeptide repeat protein [Clostridiales bacterium]|nr:tetratricopeptide repeat protein [Clostridiales bacterium]